jgi:GNAT superfamily N-acetyltransferase/nitroreductase
MSVASPALGLSASEVEAALAVASLAPSVYNSQPWRFRVVPDHLELYADLERRLPATDPEDRELRLSCGAALLNLRLALEARGVRPLVTLLPSGHRAGIEGSAALAVVRYGGHAHRSAELSRLVQAAHARRTNRQPFFDAPVPVTHRSQLMRAVESERARLYVLSHRAQRARLCQLVSDAHQEQIANPAFTAELVAWTGRAGGDRDGVPVTAGGPAPELQDEWVLRDFTADRGRVRAAGKDFESDPLLVVLCSFHQGPLAELQAGQALQHMLLTATSLGLSASFLSQPIEVPSTRVTLRRALKTTLDPQAILRIGFGSPVPPTPRRPVAELLITEPPAPRLTIWPPPQGRKHHDHGAHTMGVVDRWSCYRDQAACRLRHAAVLRLHEQLPERDRYLRLFTLGVTHLAAFIARLTTMDDAHRGAFGAFVGDELMGVAHYEVLDDPAEAEVALVVHPAAQAHGVGTLLLEHLISLARDRGVRRFVAEVLAENARMRQVFTDCGLPLSIDHDGPELHLSIPLELDEQYLDAVTERERRADSASLRALLSPRVVAVIGASQWCGHRPDRRSSCRLIPSPIPTLRRCCDRCTAHISYSTTASSTSMPSTTSCSASDGWPSCSPNSASSISTPS